MSTIPPTIEAIPSNHNYTTLSALCFKLRTGPREIMDAASTLGIKSAYRENDHPRFYASDAERIAEWFRTKQTNHAGERV